MKEYVGLTEGEGTMQLHCAKASLFYEEVVRVVDKYSDQQEPNTNILVERMSHRSSRWFGWYPRKPSDGSVVSSNLGKVKHELGFFSNI